MHAVINGTFVSKTKTGGTIKVVPSKDRTIFEVSFKDSASQEGFTQNLTKGELKHLQQSLFHYIEIRL